MKKVDARNSGASGKRSDKGVSSSNRQLSVRKDTGAKLPSAAKTVKSSSAKALPAAKKADADMVPSNEFDYSLLGVTSKKRQQQKVKKAQQKTREHNARYDKRTGKARTPLTIMIVTLS